VKLREALEECTLPLLRKIAVSLEARVDESALRAELIEALHGRLSDPGRIVDMLARLSPEEQAVLALVRNDGWTSRAFVLDRRYPRAASPSPSPRVDPSPSVSLLWKGLLFRGFDTIGEWRGEVYYVPEELRDPVGDALPAGSAPSRPVPPAPAPERLLEPSDPAYDAFCLLSFLRRENRRLARGTLAAAELARLDREAGPRPGPDSMSLWPFLLHLCRAGGWVRTQGSTLKPSRSAHRLLAGGAAAAGNRLLDTYLRDRVWSDLAAAGKVSQPVGSQRIREAQSRRLLLHYLQEMTGGEWTEERALAAALRETVPDILRQDYASLSWAVVDVASGVELQGPESWDAVEGEWIRYLLRGPLSWLGVVEWGGGSPGEMRAFRLQSPAATPEPLGEQPTFTMGEHLSLEVNRHGDLSAAYALEPYLEPRRSGAARAYRITRESVLNGLESGGSWEKLEELLGRSVHPPLSAELFRTVRQWAQSYGRYEVGVALLLTAATQEESERLGEIEGLRACLEARLGPRSYRVVPERAWELIEGLRRAGHAPKVSGSARVPGVRRAMEDVDLLKRCLLALRVVGALRPDLVDGNAAAVRRLEALLEPDELVEIERRVDEVRETPRTS
jgi:hypothetical protein